MELPYDLVIPLLCIYLKNMKTLIITPIIAALFTTDKVWKQPKCPSTDEWINKMWYIQLTLEHCGFELCRSTYKWIFFYSKH